MRKLALLLVIVAGCSGGARLPLAAKGEPVLEVRGAVKNGPFALGRADLDAMPRLGVHGVDPGTATEAVWEGASVAALVAERVELLKGADTVLVRTADGAAIPIPLTLVRQLKPVLADRANGAPLATRVLAWPTLEQRGLGTDPRAPGWWAREVVAFELVDWQRTFASALATPVGAPDSARRGAGWYGERCVACHRMRGAGGSRGPDLTTVAARLGQAPFEALLERHPGWTTGVGDPPGAEGAAELWSYLRSVAAAAPGAQPTALTAESAAPSSTPQ